MGRRDYSEYIASQEWKRRRLRALKKQGGKCKICGSKQRLRVHHLSYRNFLTRVVYALTWDLKGAAASITGIYCDQWCGVTASGQHHSGGFIPVPDEEAPYQTFVQCDLPEWGIAKTFLLFVEKFGQGD